MVVKDCSPNRAFEEEAYVKQSQFEVYQKETHGLKQLDAEYLIYSKSLWKTFYDRHSVSE
jgi:hypothetical protein